MPRKKQKKPDTINPERRKVTRDARDRFKIQLILDRYDYKIKLLLSMVKKLPQDHKDRPEYHKEYIKLVKGLYRELNKAEFSKNQNDLELVKQYFDNLSRISPFPQIVLGNKK